MHSQCSMNLEPPSIAAFSASGCFARSGREPAVVCFHCFFPLEFPREDYEPSTDSQRRHHRPRRPRQDHAGGPAAPPERAVPPGRTQGRVHPGLQPAGARAGHHHPGQELRHPLHRPRRATTTTSTSSTRPATPISAARSSACSRWPTACCCWWTPSTAPCRRPATCCPRPCTTASSPSSSSTRWTAPRPAAARSLNEVFDLLVELGADDHALDFPVVYASGRDGWAR